MKKAFLRNVDGVLTTACPHCGSRFDLGVLPAEHIDIRERGGPMMVLCNVSGGSPFEVVFVGKPKPPRNVEVKKGSAHLREVK